MTAGAASGGACSLPEPDPDSRAHGAAVATAIRAALEAAGGWLPFDEFMRLALYAPGLGYYQAGQRRFGAAGDFVTAPEISPLYGRCLARQLAQLLERLPSDAELLEFGAGTGRLACDLLAGLADAGRLPAAYRILEVSGDLRAAQRERLQAQGWCARLPVEWLDALPARPWTGIALANEVLDAMPVARFRIGADGAVEDLGVIAAGQGWAWQARPARPAVAAGVAALQGDLEAPLPPGYVSDLTLLHAPWLAALAQMHVRGAVLLADYGYSRREYYHPERDRGTLVCHYRHRVHDDPLLLAGLQDLSCSVDFTAVALAGQAAGYTLAGYAPQSTFLVGCGIDRELQACAEQSPERYLEAVAGAQRLILPGEMGERFQVLLLARDLDTDGACGYAIADRRHRL